MTVPPDPKVTPQGLFAFALAAGVLILDQVTKAAALAGFAAACPAFDPDHGPAAAPCRIPLSPIFDLTMVWNQGISFGLLRAEDWGRWLLVFFSVAVAAALAVWVRRADRRLFAASVGLIMGGAVGNVIDRIRYGAVVDFLDFSGLYFPFVFNVADAAITIGVALMLWDAYLQDRERKGREREVGISERKE